MQVQYRTRRPVHLRSKARLRPCRCMTREYLRCSLQSHLTVRYCDTHRCAVKASARDSTHRWAITHRLWPSGTEPSVVVQKAAKSVHVEIALALQRPIGCGSAGRRIRMPAYTQRHLHPRCRRPANVRELGRQTCPAIILGLVRRRRRRCRMQGGAANSNDQSATLCACETCTHWRTAAVDRLRVQSSGAGRHLLECGEYSRDWRRDMTCRIDEIIVEWRSRTSFCSSRMSSSTASIAARAPSKERGSINRVRSVTHRNARRTEKIENSMEATP